MIPIPKVKRQIICASDNFRAITLSSILGKILDGIILEKEHAALCTSDLQFGFKSGTSTTHCTNVLMETVNYYNFNKTNVYVLLLDASKAFDRVKYCKLFKELLKRDMSPLVLRLLLNMYTGQTLKVKWRNIVSEEFNVTNGVKQGGVLSPILFSVYIDGLLNRLKDSGVGCYMGNHFTGACGYADDLTLVCPTQKSLNMLVRICEIYADEFDVTFNAKKSKLLLFVGRECNDPDVSVIVNGAKIEKSESTDHLGHKISTRDRDSICTNGVAAFWKGFNIFMSRFGHVYSFLKCKLFKQYCCSFYGAPLWNLNSSAADKICIAWRRALRKLWNVPPQTHNKTIALLSDTVPLDIQLKGRFDKYIKKCLVHKNKVISNTMKMAVINPWSVVGRNYRNMNVNMLHEWKLSVSQNDVCENVFIKDLIDIREGHKTCEVFNATDVIMLIEHLCTK